MGRQDFAFSLRGVLHSLSHSAGRFLPASAGRRSKRRLVHAQPWLVGCNFLPSTAINQLEMWQPETFDAATIDRELGWAESLGFNTVRVFLHDLPWNDDRDAFFKNVDKFLEIAAKHKIRPMIVFFDGVWDPDPQSGPQNRPRARRPQQRLGAKPGPRRAGRQRQAGCAQAVRDRRS